VEMMPKLTFWARRWVTVSHQGRCVKVVHGNAPWAKETDWESVMCKPSSAPGSVLQGAIGTPPAGSSHCPRWAVDRWHRAGRHSHAAYKSRNERG
jgi:hypothetical protein